MTFLRYPHLCKFGSTETESIEFGVAHIFPKLDGTNSSIWWNNGLSTGSRNRDLTNSNNDNAGFNAWAQEQEHIKKFLTDFPQYYLYGEWLVPHTVKHYHDHAWKKFYVFDILDVSTDKFLSYDEYQPLLEQYGIDYVPCVTKIKNGSWENFLHEAKKCRYLLKDEVTQPGEGIVIKNYAWSNKQNAQVWAKIVNAEFKDDFHKAMGANLLEGKSAAQAIADAACTQALIDKEYAKIVVQEGSWTPQFIPRLLHTVFYCVVTEELWDALKVRKFNDLVNFKELQQLCIQKVKQTKPELF